MKSDLIDIEVRVIYETVKAYLVDHGGKAHVWVPRAQCEYHDGILTLPEGLAIEKEMI